MALAPCAYRLLISRRRRRMAMRFARDGVLELLLPPGRYSKAYVTELLSRCRDTIEDLRRRSPAPRSEIPAELLVFGTPFPVVFVPGKAGFDGQTFHLPEGPKVFWEHAMIRVYVELAQKLILPRARQLAEHYGVAATQLAVGRATGSWGSCSRSGRIRFSWRLAQCPKELVDYVICHELAHCKEFSHSPNFWHQLEVWGIPGRELRRQLREYSRDHRLY